MSNSDIIKSEQIFSKAEKIWNTAISTLIEKYYRPAAYYGYKPAIQKYAFIIKEKIHY